MEGMSKWVLRVWRIVQSSIGTQDTSSTLKHLFEKTVAKVTDDMEKRRYNTAIASLMELTNAIGAEGGKVGREELKKLILMLAPFAPHMTEEAWNQLYGKETYTDPKDSVHSQTWPSYDHTVLQNEDVSLVVQVNGKLRDTMTVSPSEAQNQAEIEKKAGASVKVRTYLDGRTIIKIVFVPGKLINFVVKD